MKHSPKLPLRLTLLSSATAIGLLALSSTAALAASVPGVQRGQPEVSATVADYTWQGKHYNYHQNGHYYNHRRKENGHYKYY
jgi:hypothetical protein